MLLADGPIGGIIPGHGRRRDMRAIPIGKRPFNTSSEFSKAGNEADHGGAQTRINLETPGRPISFGRAIG